ncbi:MAG TPA: SRPBCC family protein [Solirubrobacterales bacterium]|nr:SRPBCC family protein [Solirubrobacterales bacterium]
MGPVYAEIEIDAPREQIFEYLMDIATRPDLYGDSISNFRLLRLESRGIGAGARFQFKRRDTWADTSIVAAESPRRISERGTTGKLNRTKTGTEWEIAESPGGVSTVRVSYWTEPTGMAKMFDRMKGGAGWYGRLVKRVASELRDRVEHERTDVVPVGVAGGNRYATGVR